MIVQTIIFDADIWNAEDARFWLRHHKYRWALDVKDSTFRARQIDPGCFRKGTFRTIRFGKTWHGIQAVVGKLRG